MKKIMISVIVFMLGTGWQTMYAHCIETICESREGHHCVEDAETSEWKCSSGSKSKVDNQEKASSDDSSEEE